MNKIADKGHYCPGCGRENISVFFESRQLPVLCNILWPDRDQALSTPRADIRLAFCHHCGLIYNTCFNPEIQQYNNCYENSLHFSPRFRQYAENLAQQLVQSHQLYGKDILEIGCGQGQFLDLLTRLGNNKAVGFDPSFDADKSASPLNANVTVIPEAYPKHNCGLSADFICCRHVLEHIAGPLDFLRDLRDTIANRYETIVFFEVPNALYTFRDMGLWDIIYEHCSYFTADSLNNIFLSAGFKPLRLTKQYDGQFLTVTARPNCSGEVFADSPPPIQADIEDCIHKFGSAHREKINFWHDKLRQLKHKNIPTVLWGAGSKGVTFLNTMETSGRLIEYVVDINPRKQGKFIGGTGQQIVSAKFLKSYQPEVIIIMNRIYQSEIEDTLQSLGLDAEILSA